MTKIVFSVMLPFMLYGATVSQIYRIGSASTKTTSDHYVGGTLLGYKLHVQDRQFSYAADVNYILTEDNEYGVDDVVEGMIHLGFYPSDALEVYGGVGYAIENKAGGFGYGAGLVYDITKRFSITLEYREFDLDNSDGEDYTLKGTSLGIMIGF